MASIKEIAGYCGVSVATVSKALNDRDDIGEETKQKVREAARRLGYIPDASARTLRTRHSYTLGLLFGNETGNAFTDEFFPHIINAIKIAAEKRGYEISFLHKTNGSRTMSYLEHCMNRKVDGVVTAYIHYDNPEVTEMLRSSLPVVTLDYVFNGRTAVCFDYVQGMEMLVSHICDMGHQRIAYITGQKSKITWDRLAGFYRAAEKRGIQIPDEYVREGNYLDYQKAAQLTREFLAMPKPPTCILYPNDFSAIGGIGTIYGQGLSIPEDISVAGYDGIPVARAMQPELTTLVQDTERMGEAVVQKLTDLIDNSYKVSVERILVPGRVSPGGTVKRLVR